MTTTPTQQPEALKLADALHEVASLFGFPYALLQSAAELRRLHAENEALRAKIAESRTPLTTDQKLRIALDCNMRVRTGSGAIKFAAAIEAAHGINP